MRDNVDFIDVELASAIEVRWHDESMAFVNLLCISMQEEQSCGGVNATAGGQE
jgi:hypothetical protein